MSAAALAEFVILKPDRQETILHNSRFPTPPVVSPYSDAVRAIRTYSSDPTRPHATFENVKRALTEKSKSDSFTPKKREEALRCIEAIELFQNNENVFGLRSLRIEEPPKLSKLVIEGVKVAVTPDLLVRSVGSKGEQRIGLIFLRPQKAPDPNACRLAETKHRYGEHRREMARYMLALAELLVKENEELGGTFDQKNSFVADLRLGERINFSTKERAARIRSLHAACRQISRQWDAIEPRSSVTENYKGRPRRTALRFV